MTIAEKFNAAGDPADPISALFRAIWTKVDETPAIMQALNPANAQLMLDSASVTQSNGTADVPSIMLTVVRLNLTGKDSATDNLSLWLRWQLLTGSIVFYGSEFTALLWQLLMLTRRLNLGENLELLPGVELVTVELDANSSLGLGAIDGKGIVGHSSVFDFRCDLDIAKGIYNV